MNFHVFLCRPVLVTFQYQSRPNCKPTYEELGLRSDATQLDIRQAYLRLAKEYHPDKTGDSSSKESFQNLCKAYWTLQDPATRAEYDRFHNLNAHPTSYGTSSECVRVKTNAFGLTLAIDEGMFDTWLNVTKDFYPGIKTNNRDIHGIQMTMSYSSEVNSGPVLGTLSLTFYKSTSKVHVQGTSYLLWLQEHYVKLHELVKTRAQETEGITFTNRRISTRLTSSHSKMLEQAINESICETCDTLIGSTDAGGSWKCHLCSSHYHGLCTEPSWSDSACHACDKCVVGDVNPATTPSPVNRVDKTDNLENTAPNNIASTTLADNILSEDITNKKHAASTPTSEKKTDNILNEGITKEIHTVNTPTLDKNTDNMINECIYTEDIHAASTPTLDKKPALLKRLKAKRDPRDKNINIRTSPAKITKKTATAMRKSDTQTHRGCASLATVLALQQTVHELESKYVNLLNQVDALNSINHRKIPNTPNTPKINQETQTNIHHYATESMSDKSEVETEHETKILVAMDIPTDNRFEILDVEGADAADDMETPVGTPDESGSSVTITDKADTSDGSTPVVETETTITPPSEKPEGSADRAEPNLNSTTHDKPSNASHPQANVQNLNTRDIPNNKLSQQKAPAAVDMMIVTSSIGKALEAKRIY